jgi:uncharacterized membrane protein
MNDRSSDFGKVRLEALSDGIFAIAMTVLVLNLNPPDFPDGATNAEVYTRLSTMAQSFIGFCASFITLGMYWMTHHLALRFLVRSDRVILWLNMYLLLLVSLVPFTTAIYAGDVDNIIVNTIFGANLIFLGILNYALWAYASRMGYLFHELTAEEKHFTSRRILTAPLVACLAMVAAMFQPRFAEAIYFAMVPVFMLSVRPLWVLKSRNSGNNQEKSSST